MANKKALFGILDPGDGTGAGIDKVNPDTTLGSAVDCTMATPVFVNSSGVLVFPQLNPDGSIPVDVGGGGVCRCGYANVIGSTSFQDLGSLPSVTTGKIYDNIGWSVSSSTEACYELVRIDDSSGTPVETVKACWVTGPGQYSYGIGAMPCLEISTVGGTGTQVIKIRAKLLEATGSEICGTITASESPA